MRREAEVVVGAHVEHAPAVGEGDPRLLAAGDGVLFLEEALRFRLLESSVQGLLVGSWIHVALLSDEDGVHAVAHSRMTLPERPESITSKAASYSVQANRCVITGETLRPLWSMAVILYQVSYIWRP